MIIGHGTACNVCIIVLLSYQLWLNMGMDPIITNPYTLMIVTKTRIGV